VTPEQARNQALAACGAVLIAFIGFCHEVVGDLLFPWGPELLGGPIGWHGTGLLAICTGLLLLAGTLGVIRFPVIPVALIVSVVGLLFLVIAATRYDDLHAFTLAASFAGLCTAHFHKRAVEDLSEMR
jgi:hypothetical protein